MNRRIGILAALPRELKPLVRGWKRLPSEKNVSLWTFEDDDGDQLVAACAGMGAYAARKAFAAAVATGALHMVLSVGLAGATRPSLAAGGVHVADEIIDVQTGERFTWAEGGPRLRLATLPQVASAAEKTRLLASYDASLVDMEAATVARLAAMRGIAAGCFKAVSDTADAKLPEIDRFVDGQGQLSMLHFAAHLARSPRSWAPVAKLARSSGAASEALAQQIALFLQHKDLAYTNRTGQFAKEPTSIVSAHSR